MAQRGQLHVERMARAVERAGPHVETMEPVVILDRIDDIEKLDKVARRTFGIDDCAERRGCIVNVNLLSVEAPEIEPVLTAAEIDGHSAH